MNPPAPASDVTLEHLPLHETLNVDNDALRDAVQRLLDSRDDEEEFEVCGFSNFV